MIVLGVETMTRLDTAAANEVLARMAPPNERALGVTTAAQVALMTRAYRERFGTTRAQLLASPIKAHEAGARNPLAQFQKAVNLQSLLDAPEVAAPVGRCDCAPMSDGAAAFLVTRPEGKLPTNVGGVLKARGHPVGAIGAAQVCELFWQLTGHDAVRNSPFGGSHQDR